MRNIKNDMLLGCSIALFSLILNTETALAAGCIDGSCEGYTKTAAECSGKNAIRCPFDTSKYFCVSTPVVTDSCEGYYTIEHLANNLDKSCVYRQYMQDKCDGLVNQDAISDSKVSLKLSWFFNELFGIKNAYALINTSDPCANTQTATWKNRPIWCPDMSGDANSIDEEVPNSDQTNPILIIMEACPTDSTRVKAYWGCPDGYSLLSGILNNTTSPGTCVKKNDLSDGGLTVGDGNTGGTGNSGGSSGGTGDAGNSGGGLGGNGTSHPCLSEPACQDICQCLHRNRVLTSDGQFNFEVSTGGEFYNVTDNCRCSGDGNAL